MRSARVRSAGSTVLRVSEPAPIVLLPGVVVVVVLLSVVVGPAPIVLLLDGVVVVVVLLSVAAGAVDEPELVPGMVVAAGGVPVVSAGGAPGEVVCAMAKPSDATAAPAIE